MKKLVAVAATAALLTVGGAGIAAAADSPSPTPPSSSAPAPRLALAKDALRAAAGALGMDPKDLARQLRSGKSIADVAKAKDVPLSKVVDAVVQHLRRRIDDAVTAGQLDATRAAKLKDRLEDRVGKLVERKRYARGALRRTRRELLATAASTIGIDPKGLLRELRGGKSIAAVAQEHGVDAQKVVDALTSAADQKVDDAVKAGKLDASRAATLKARLAARIQALVNRTPRVGARRAAAQPAV